MHALFAAALLAHRPHDEVASLAATADGRIVFAVVRSILYASGDGGDTWKLSNRGLPQLSAGYDKRYVPSTTIVLSSTFAEDLSAFLEMKSCDGAHSGLFATRDGGLNWFELENAPAIDPRARAAVAISTNFANDQTLLLAGADGMLHRSADAGRSFQPVGQLDCTVLKAVQRAFFCGSVDGGLFWSGASGTAWSQVLLSAGNGTDVTSMEEISSPIPSIPLVKEQEVVLLVSTTTHVYVTKFGRDTGALMLYRSILTADGVPTSTGYIGSSIFVVEQAHKRAGLVKVSADGGNSWSDQGADGLHRHMQDIVYDTPSFNLFTSCPQGNRAFLASFTGVYRRDGDGAWVNLETIAQIITSLSVGDDSDGLLSVSVCTMAGGCFSTRFNPSTVLPPLGLPSSTVRKWLPPLPDQFGFDQYNIAVHSPTFAHDGVIIRASSTAHKLFRSDDWGVTWTFVPTKRMKPHYPMVVHTIAFSPSFAFDGTVFLAGFNLGVGRSTDGGRTFELLWSEPGFNTKLSLSPGFGTGGDRSVLAMLTPMLPEDQVRLSPSLDSVHFGSYERRDVNSGGPKDVPQLRLSDDSGITWRPIGESGGFRAAVFAHQTILALNGKDLVVNASAPVVGPYAWCTLPLNAYAKQRPSGFGRGALAVSPDFETTREVAIGWPEGGLLVARLQTLPDGQCNATVRSVAKPEPDVTDSAAPPWSFVHTIPPDNSARVGTALVAFSPRFAQDGVIFGASFYSVMASFDRGINWRALFSLNHSRASCAEDCLRCQGSYNYAGSSYFDRPAPRHYCLLCKPPAYRNNSTGACSVPTGTDAEPGGRRLSLLKRWGRQVPTGPAA